MTAESANIVATAPDAFAIRVRAHLQVIASQSTAITYQTLAKALDLMPPNTIHQVTEALERLMQEDAASGQPFIAAVVIGKARGGLPAPGFFDCARRFGRFADGQDPTAFHTAELNAVFARWSGSRDNQQ
jgi:hypothetical protein